MNDSAHPGEAASHLARSKLRLRIVFGPTRLGPGKVDLLEAVGRTGSISAAGRALGMSYRRAWLLVDAVNRLFREPAVIAVAGGAQGGGAHLTPFGQALVAAYRRIETRTRDVVLEEMATFETAFAEEGVEAPGDSD